MVDINFVKQNINVRLRKKPSRKRSPRKIFRVSFQGRPARALLWRKVVYKEWFEFARISPLSCPKEFGDPRSFNNFKEWWEHPDYGLELFCEPEEQSVVEVVSDIADIDDDCLYMKVNLNWDFDICVARMKSLLKEKRKGVKIIDYQSMARFQPSVEMKRIHLDTLNRQRKAWQLQQQGFMREEIWKRKTLNYNEDLHREHYLRVVSRDIQRAKAVFKNISKGTFP